MRSALEGPPMLSSYKAENLHSPQGTLQTMPRIHGTEMVQCRIPLCPALENVPLRQSDTCMQAGTCEAHCAD